MGPSPLLDRAGDRWEGHGVRCLGLARKDARGHLPNGMESLLALSSVSLKFQPRPMVPLRVFGLRCILLASNTPFSQPETPQRPLFYATALQISIGRGHSLVQSRTAVEFFPVKATDVGVSTHRDTVIDREGQVLSFSSER